MNTDVTLDFAGGKFRFHINEQQMHLLELGMGGPMNLPQPPLLMGPAYARLLQGRFIRDGEEVASPAHAEFSATQIGQIIRAGLIGGGGGEIGGKHISWKERDDEGYLQHDPDDYIKRYVHPMPLVERWDLALVIMGAAVEGIAPKPADD